MSEFIGIILRSLDDYKYNCIKWENHTDMNMSQEFIFLEFPVQPVTRSGVHQVPSFLHF